VTVGGGWAISTGTLAPVRGRGVMGRTIIAGTKLSLVDRDAGRING